MSPKWGGYTKLIEQCKEAFHFDFIKEAYNHDLEEIVAYLDVLMGQSLSDKYQKRAKRLEEQIRILDSVGLGSYQDMINCLDTRSKIQSILNSTPLNHKDIREVVYYITYWVLPAKTYLTQLVPKEESDNIEHIKTLRKYGIRFTWDIMEKARTETQRRAIYEASKVPVDLIYRLVNLADMTRMPFVGGKTIKHYDAAGFGSLKKLADSEYDSLKEALAVYFEGIGMKLSGSFIVPRDNIRYARYFPALIEY